MKIDGRCFLVTTLLTCTIATRSFAGVAPYVRLDFGGSGFRMTEANTFIKQSETSLKSAGYPAAFQKVGTAFGPSASVGLWLFRGFRLGGTYSYLRSTRNNRVHVPGQLFYADDLVFKMTELGGEAAVRVARLGGLTVGANVANGRGELIEGFSVQDPYSLYTQDATAHRSKMTYGGFIGFDQTSLAGVAGFVRVGFQYRDIGKMPSHLSISDGTTSWQATGTTIPLNYTGVYFKAGVGYDLGH